MAADNQKFVKNSQEPTVPIYILCLNLCPKNALMNKNRTLGIIEDMLRYEFHYNWRSV